MGGKKEDPTLYIIITSLHPIMNKAMKGDSNVTFMPYREKKT